MYELVYGHFGNMPILPWPMVYHEPGITLLYCLVTADHRRLMYFRINF